MRTVKVNGREMSGEEYDEFKRNISNFLPFDEITSLVDDTKRMLDVLSDNAAMITSHNNHIFILSGSQILSGIKTLGNILLCCKTGSFSDANVLLRKYRDDLFQWLYMVKTIEESNKYLLGKDIPSDLKVRMKVIHLWIKGELILDSNRKLLKEHFAAHVYIKHIIDGDEIKRCCDDFFSNTWKLIDKNANDYVHANSDGHLRDNFLEIPYLQKERVQRCLNDVCDKIKSVTIYFLSLLLLIDSHLIMSSDHILHLDCDLEPPEGSQNWIASVFQVYFDKYISALSLELVEYLRNNNSHCMLIE